jgi:uncharacterized membrane protein
MMKENANGGTGAPLSEKDKGTAMAVLAYLGPLVIVSYFVAKDIPFVKFHIKQGLVLFVIEVAFAFIVKTFWIFLFFMAFLIPFIQLGIAVLAILGIVNAVQGKEKELPLVGSFGKVFPL